MPVEQLAEKRRFRLPVLALAMVGLLAALWAGILRIGWNLPILQPTLPMSHGPLMVCGFLGTLISLERAVALNRLWAFSAPLLMGAGGLLLILGVVMWQGPLLITAGSIVLLIIFATVMRIQNERFLQVMGLGALCLFIGNVFWLTGAAVFDIVYWWMGFLVLTITGERLELSRMLMHSPNVQKYFLYLVGASLVGLIVVSFARDFGVRLTGITFVAFALWLLVYDIARHTIRQRDLTRYIAACLLSGYFWLAVGGALAVIYGGVLAGPVYDAVLHAVFVGFVFSMIFGHAPIIFPSILGIPIFYRTYFYVPLFLLHVSLVLRLVGDLGGGLTMRKWGGMVNAVSVLLFLLGVVYTILSTRREVLEGGR